jgi:hypothetical protein
MGPIQVSSSGRYFVDHDAKPFFWLGDTQWELFRAFSFADAQAILENRKSKGFTVIQVMLTGVGDGSKPNLAGQSPWVNDDPATPNEAYFEHVDAVVELGDRYGLVLVLGIFHQLQTRHITQAKARVWSRWLAQRYHHAPNIIWTMYPRAEQAFVPIVRELTAGLCERDKGAHLISVHPDPSPASSSFLHRESWLAFNSIQTWKYVDQIYPMVSVDYDLKPAKPVVMAEGAYEGGSEYGFDVTPLWVRRQAYTSYLAGGHHTYGHNDSWRVPTTWKEALDAPGAFQMGILGQVFRARNEWWKGIPDQSVFAHTKKDGPLLSVAARSARGDWVLAYLSTRTTVAVRMSKITASSMVEASWVDPTTGVKTPIGRFANTGVRRFSTPEPWEDAVLVLEQPAS